MMKTNDFRARLRFAFLRAGAVLLLLVPIAYGAERATSREEAQFDIFVSGRRIGQEKFSIRRSGDSVSSASTIRFRAPGSRGQDVKMETELTMDDRLVPRDYQLRTDVGGQKATIRGTFAAGQASFEYRVGGSPRKSGLMVGDRYCVLDTNVFHHFVFVARLFDFSSEEKSQAFEVVIPQELGNGLLKVSDMGLENISVRGRKRDLHRLRADSGSVQIDLWVDDQRILFKIALPAKRIEVVRD